MTDPLIVTTRRLLLNHLSIALVGLSLAWLSGCRPSASVPTPQLPAEAAETPAGDEATPAGGDKTPAGAQPLPGAEPEASSEATPTTALAVLEAMAAAYRKASTYSDKGTVRLAVQRADGPIDQWSDFAVVFERPNKIRMDVYEANVVCDGKVLRATIADLPDQVLVKEAPDELTMKSIYGDRELASALSMGFVGGSPSLMLLLADNSLDVLLQGVERTTLDERGKIGDHDCYRVRITRRDGTTVFWIDRKTYVLRRIEFPVDELRQMLAQGGEVKDVSLVANFTDARFGMALGAEAFQFEMPADAKQVTFFVPPHPAQLLGKKVPDFKFVDLNGKPITPESLAGKIVVLNFWATWCGYCRESLPVLSKVAQQYKDKPNVVFLAVSIDTPDIENKTLRETAAAWGASVPIARDPKRNMNTVFRASGAPNSFILDAESVVQDFEIGANPDLAAVLPKKLDQLLANKDIYHEPLAEYKKQLEEYERAMEAPEPEMPEGDTVEGDTVQGDTVESDTVEGNALESDTVEGDKVEEHRIPRPKIAQRSQPETFKLTPLWKCTELKAPGNIVVVPRPGAAPRLLVVDAWKSIAEVGLDGKLLATHKLDIDRMEVVSTLRTAVGADGKRYFAAFFGASTQQRFHLLDEEFNLVLSYPKDALKNPHRGIADVELGDLDGDGTLQAYVGYWGVIGVQAVSLEGKRVWSNRAISNVAKMAIGGPDSDGKRLLFCTNISGSLATIDAAGNRKDTITVQRKGDVTDEDRVLRWIVAADLTGDGKLEWCGMAGMHFGDNLVVGLTLAGDELWNYSLPHGVYPQAIEPIIPGRLAPGADAQWLLPGPDGSIHVIAADGKPLDRFNHGAALSGLATAESSGRRMLIVASKDALEAWSVE